jgi:hypothetical protein
MCSSRGLLARTLSHFAAEIASGGGVRPAFANGRFDEKPPLTNAIVNIGFSRHRSLIAFVGEVNDRQLLRRPISPSKDCFSIAAYVNGDCLAA